MRISDWSSDVCSSDLIKLPHLMAVLKKSVISSAVIMFIIANAGLSSFMLTRAGVPDMIGTFLAEHLTSPNLFLLGVNAAPFITGMFIETSASIILLAPILVPVAMQIGSASCRAGVFRYGWISVGGVN